MLTLGIYCGEDGRAAALSRDGQILSACNADGMGSASSSDRDRVLDEIVVSCLHAAEMRADEVDYLVQAGDLANVPSRLSSVLGERVPLHRALALQARAASEEDTGVLLLSTSPTAFAFLAHVRNGLIARERTVAGADEFMAALRAVAAALGLSVEHPFASLEAIADSGTSSVIALPDAALAIGDGGSFAVDMNSIAAFLDAARRASPRPLDSDVQHVGAQRVRRDVAAAVLERAALLAAGLARAWARSTGATSTALGGDVLADQAFVARVTALLGNAFQLPVPEHIGAALGAALTTPSSLTTRINRLALGRKFDEQEIKTVLENCRLDYVYEPGWPTLLGRVSTLLSGGALVAWFQGPADFGLRSFGSRSVLCDPSNVYARENVNVFLRGVPTRHTIPLSLAPSAVAAMGGRSSDPLHYVASVVPPGLRDTVKGAIDAHGMIYAVHADVTTGGKDFAALLDAHYARTGVPGLINVPLAGASAPLAEDPRAAIRQMFGSAVDALVIGRFLVTKDYWLLRGSRSLQTT